MKYQLTLFDRLLNEDFYDAINAPNKLNEFRNYLQKRFDPCLKYFHFQFEEGIAGKYHPKFYQETGFYTRSNFEIPECIDIEIDNALLNLLLKKCLDFNRIPKENIIKKTYKKDKKDLHLYVTAKYDHQSIPNEDIIFYYYQTFISEEIRKIKQSFKSQIFRLKRKEDIRLYVQNHQENIKNISKLIIEKLEETMEEKLFNIFTKKNLHDNLLKLLYENIEEIHDYIENNFAKYIDFNIPVIYGQRVKLAKEIKEKLECVLQYLKTGTFSDDLVRIAEKPFNRLLGLKEDDCIAKKDIKYLRQLLDEYNEAYNTGECTDTCLSSILFDANYNTVDFFNYLTDKILIDINTIESMELKKERLYFYLKKYLQYIPKPGVIYNPDLPPVKEQITCWLREEIEFIEMKINSEKTKDIENIKSVETIKKVEVSLPVAQLGCFFKLLDDTGVTTNKNKSDIFRAVAKTFATQKVRNISTESFSSKFYNIELSTRHAVKDLVIKMLNAINREQ